MAAFASMGKHLDQGITLLEALEKISEFDRLGHSSALSLNISVSD
jgi:hypothetical protein